MAPVHLVHSEPTAAPLHLHWFSALDKFTPPPQLIRDLIVDGSLVLLFGPSNCGKSFLAVDMALHVAAGRPWRGMRTKPGLVIYVAGEGAASISARVVAFRRSHPDWSGGTPFALLPQAVDFMNRESVEELLATIRDAERHSGHKATLVIVDTLARAMAGADENSAQDIGQVVGHADLIRQVTGATVLLVHHTGKDVERGARGSSALRAAVDTEIECKGLAGQRMATVAKQRDLETGAKLPFTLRVVNVGSHPETGEPVTSCIVIHDSQTLPGAAPAFKFRGKAQRQLLDAVRERTKADPERIWSLGELRRVGRDCGQAKGTARTAVEGLAASPYLRLSEGGYLFTYGEAED